MTDVASRLRQCAPLFHALGDPARQEIILLLAQHERLTVGAVADQLTVSRPTVSHHLKVLVQAGIVGVEKVARERFHFLTIDTCLNKIETLYQAARTDFST